MRGRIESISSVKDRKQIIQLLETASITED